MISIEYEDNNGAFVDIEVEDPECGDVFCDYCGDCAVCYGNDECFDGSRYRTHRFIVYKGMEWWT